jgi:acyl-CoA synthetase (AMP-forming)/AMP-acid ligase II
MNFSDYIFANTRESGRIAYIHDGAEHAYRDVYRRVLRYAALIGGAGGGENARAGGAGDSYVFVLADNSGFFIEAYFAAIKSGRVCVPLNPSASIEEVRYIRDICKPELVFIQARHQKKFSGVFSGGQKVITENDAVDGFAPGASGGAGIAGGAGAESAAGAAAGEALAVVLFTSGSTGKPKGVMLTHANLRCNTGSIIEYLRIGPCERALAVLPFFYCFGTSILHTHFREGACVVLNNEFMFPDTVGEYIQKYGCTSFSGVPGTFQILLRKSGFAARKYPTLRYVAQAGGKLSPVFINELAAALPGTQVFVMYGQTEATSRLSYLPPRLLGSKMGSIGKGIPGVELRVEDAFGRDVKPGEVGQIVARGGNIMKGYLNDQEATEAALRGGALYTGDLATVDGDGYIYVVGREKQIIKYAGYRISPKEIEDVILSMKDVLEAVVFGADDDILGEAPKAAVVLKDGAGRADGDIPGEAPKTAVAHKCGARFGEAPARGDIGRADSSERARRAGEIMAYCRERLPSYKLPAEIEIVQGGLPKNAAGKLLLTEIKERYGRLRSRRAAAQGKAGAGS